MGLSMSDIKAGDRVRVLPMEVEVADLFGPVGSKSVEFKVNDIWHSLPLSQVEKVEPPVEVFGPGDAVKLRDSYDKTSGYSRPRAT